MLLVSIMHWESTEDTYCMYAKLHTQTKCFVIKFHVIMMSPDYMIEDRKIGVADIIPVNLSTFQTLLSM